MKETHNRQLELLVTDHCSLCDQAFDLLASDPELAGWQLTLRDVVADDQLFAEYAEVIPVLRKDGRVLNWPFSTSQVHAWLRVSVKEHVPPDLPT